MNFDFQLPTRIVFGRGRLKELGRLAKELGSARVLVVSDSGVVGAGHTAAGVASLEAAGLTVMLFSGVEENPTTEHVDAGLAVATDFRPDLIVAIGGGSSMDCAKGINFLYACGGRMEDYWGIGKATNDLAPMIAVPTTAGTGSETQSFALISDARTHVKMACGDKRAAFRVALLDPELTLTQPDRVTALSGIDAVAHAIETMVTTRRNSISIALSREAWRHLAPNYPRVLQAPDDKDARAEMQLGAMFAGMAIENSMLGAAHALANPLTANYDIAHGEAVALMLPHVIRYNVLEDVARAAYRELLASARMSSLGAIENGTTDDLAAFVERMRGAAGLAESLSSCQIEQDQLPRLAAEAAAQWTARFNPRNVTETEMLKLYQNAF